MLKLYANKVNLQPQFLENLHLVVYIVTLKVFLPSVYKFDMVYVLVYRCFSICSNWAEFHTELTFLRGIFCKNSYPENFIDK